MFESARGKTARKSWDFSNKDLRSNPYTVHIAHLSYDGKPLANTPTAPEHLETILNILETKSGAGRAITIEPQKFPPRYIKQPL